jgi:hypothetical protein
MDNSLPCQELNLGCLGHSQKYIYCDIPALGMEIMQRGQMTLVQENQVRRELNGTYQLLVYTDDKNLSGDNINTINKKTVPLTVASK